MCTTGVTFGKFVEELQNLNMPFAGKWLSDCFRLVGQRWAEEPTDPDRLQWLVEDLVMRAMGEIRSFVQTNLPYARKMHEGACQFMEALVAEVARPPKDGESQLELNNLAQSAIAELTVMQLIPYKPRAKRLS